MKNQFYSSVLIIFISSLGQIMSDLYLPSMAAITQTFNTTHHTVQLSLSFFMYGLAISQLIYGIVSDAIGRKKPLLVGIILCLMGSLLCSFAINIQIFILGRFLQGFGAGAGIGLSRAIMRDVFSKPADYVRMGSYLTIAMIILIMLAPLIGGYLQNYFGWRISFMSLSGYALLVLALVTFCLAETSQHHHLDNFKLKSIMLNVWQVMTNLQFIGYIACIFLVYGGMLAWLTTGPILIVQHMGLSPVIFGWVCVVIGIFYILGCLLNARLSKFNNINFMLTIGISLMLISGIILLLLTLTKLTNFINIIVLAGVFCTAGSFIFANAGAGALSAFKKIAGTAGALAGFIQIAGGAIASTASAIMPSNTTLPLACTFIVCGSGALVALMIVKHDKTINY